MRCVFLVAGLAIVSLLTGPGTFAQAPDAQPGSPQWFFDVVPATPPTDLTTREGQRYLQTLHAVGRHDLHAAFPSSMARQGPCEPWPDVDVGPQSVVAAIVELARNTSIVIINEAHDESRHRDGVRHLAVALREAGYAHVRSFVTHGKGARLSARRL
jgi:hypothetical protein